MAPKYFDQNGQKLNKKRINMLTMNGVKYFTNNFNGSDNYKMTKNMVKLVMAGTGVYGWCSG